MGPTPEMQLAFDDDAAALYTVGQVAGMLELPSAFLRRLDRERVVQPARSDGGQRRYSRLDVAQIQHVTRMTDEGMTLVGIRRILELESEIDVLKKEIAALQAG